MTLFGNQSQLSLADSREYKGGNLASRIATQESVRHLLTSVICGENLQGLFAKLNPDGLWEKTYQGYFQVKTDGTLEEYSGTWPAWGIMQDGAVYAPHGLEPSIDESGYLLLPTITASESKSVSRKRYRNSKHYKGTKMSEALRSDYNDPNYLHPRFAEAAMGFPDYWTDLNV